MFKEFLKIPINEHNINNAVAVIVLDLSKVIITIKIKLIEDTCIINKNIIYVINIYELLSFILF